jgi:putative folate metabolism gamma-glutamate ligase
MKIVTVKTPKIAGRQKIKELLASRITNLGEGSVVAITSKIVSICEGRAVDKATHEKLKLVIQEADLYLPGTQNSDTILTIKNNILIPCAGIDESNGYGKYILWPQDAQKSADDIRRFLKTKYQVKKIGVIITDSKTSPLRWGTTGISVAHSGFRALNNYTGRKDLFGRKLKYTKSNIADGLAAAAVLAMGEGSEQTPIAIISDLPFVHFQKNNPSSRELANLQIDLKDDIYGRILRQIKWLRSDNQKIPY